METIETNGARLTIENGLLIKVENADDHMILPDGIITISDKVFKNCYNLKSITIPEGVTCIEDEAFSGCSSLTTITIPSSVKSIGKGTFIGCRKLTSITIPEGVTCIEEGTFERCDNLTSITIPESVTCIGEKAFLYCRNITTINIPNSVKTISKEAFQGCRKLTSVIIPNGVTRIEASTFFGCESLVSIQLPNEVTYIGKDTFCRCDSLTSVTIPDGVTCIESRTFFGCKSLTSINIPGGITRIGNEAFKECKSLKSIYLPNKVTFIGERAFESCDNLTSVIIPNGVTSIEAKTFYECKKLTYISIPESVTSIGDLAFMSCHMLKSISLPTSITNLGRQCFENNTAIEVYNLLQLLFVQKTKTGSDTILCMLKGRENVFPNLIDIISHMGKINKKCETTIINIIKTCTIQDKQEATKLVSVISEKDSAVAERIKNTSEIKEITGNLHPIETYVIDLLEKADNKSFEDDRLNHLKYYIDDLNKRNIAGLPYNDGSGISSERVVKTFLGIYMCVLNSISNSQLPLSLTHNWYKEYNPSPEGETIANAFEPKAFQKFIGSLINTRYYYEYILSFMLYANEEQISQAIELVSHGKLKGVDKNKGKAIIDLIYLSKTNAAEEFINDDKRCTVLYYAKLNGFSDETEYRDSKGVSNFGFDENGIIKYDLSDGITIEARLSDSLEVGLYDSVSGEQLNKFPKPFGDVQKYNECKESYKQLQDNLNDFLKKRIDSFREMYFFKALISANTFSSLYLKNPIMKRLVKMAIWQDASNTRFMIVDKAIDSNGNPVEYSGNITLAHIMDMSEMELNEWRNYVTTSSSKLLIDQIGGGFSQKSGRNMKSYVGKVFPVAIREEAKRRLAKIGIKARVNRSFTPGYNYATGMFKTFDQEATWVIGRSVEISYECDDKNGLMKITGAYGRRDPEFQREKCEIAAILNTVIVEYAIKKSDVNLISTAFLNTLSADTILSLIDEAIAHNSSECVVVLMNYKNKNYPSHNRLDNYIFEI